MRFSSQTTTDEVVERQFQVDDVPGVLRSPAAVTDGCPLVLLGHGGGQHKSAPGLVARPRLRDRRRLRGGGHRRARLRRPAEDRVPEWQAALTALQQEMGTGPVGYWGLSLGSLIGVPSVAADLDCSLRFFARHLGGAS
jgi:hypothetical protein